MSDTELRIYDYVKGHITQTPTTWIELGQYLGYPPCCIRAFVNLEHLGDPTQLSIRPLIGTGFVCCEDCAEYYTARELTNIINAHRTCPTPFPKYRGVS